MAGLTRVTTGGITDGTITNADISSSAAIAASKVSGLSTDKIEEGNTAVEVVDTGSDGHITFDTEGTEKARFDTSGRLLIGTNSPRVNGYNSTSGQETKLQIEGTNYGSSSLSIVRNSDDAVDGALLLGKTRGTAALSNAALSLNDYIGRISFQGSDGSGLVEGATIRARITTNTSNNDMPTSLLFSTTADSGTSPTERMRITHAGRVGIGTDSPDTTVDIEDSQAELIVKSTGSNSAGFRLIPNNDTNALYIYADTSRNICIDDHATGRLQVQADGDLSITDGNLVLADGHGIDFSATSGTGTSELLDDYEEGTWTPRLNGWNGSSYVNVSNTTNAEAGHYIKVGRKVTVFIRYEWSSLAVANGNPLYIYDLPFNVTNDHHSAGSMARIGGISDVEKLRIYKYTGSTNMFYIQTAGANNLSGMNGNNGQFIATITYMASA